MIVGPAMIATDVSFPGPSEPQRSVSGLADRITARITTILEATSRLPPPRLRNLLLAVGGAVLLVVGYIAARSLDLDLAEVGWGWLLLAALVGVPLTIASNTLEYQVSARLVGSRISWGEAVRTTVLATTANLLPLPGGALVRIQALRTYGNPYRQATYATALMGFSWVGVSALIAGLLLLPVRWEFGLGWIAVGVSLLLVTITFVARRVAVGKRVRIAATVLSIELLSVFATGLRLYFVLVALDAQPTVVSAAMFALATVLGSAVGVFPGGLGIKELLAALFAPIVGLPAAVGFLTAAVNRIVGLVAHAPLAFVVSIGGSNGQAPYVERSGQESRESS